MLSNHFKIIRQLNNKNQYSLAKKGARFEIMKITVIYGQNHKGSSYRIGRSLAEKSAPEQEITELFLPRDLNHHCLGCYSCLNDETKCPFFEEKKIIADAMQQADLLIFATPTYCMAPSAPMKAFFDLFFQYWISHRPKKSMFSKKAVVVSTAAGIGAGRAVKQVEKMLKYWGIPYIKTYAVTVQASEWSEVKTEKKNRIDKDMEKLARKIKNKGPRKPSPYIRFLFNIMADIRRKNPDYMAAESVYWRENGWLDKSKPWNSQHLVN